MLEGGDHMDYPFYLVFNSFPPILLPRPRPTSAVSQCPLHFKDPLHVRAPPYVKASPHVGPCQSSGPRITAGPPHNKAP